MLTQAPKGTQDMLPSDAHRWQKIEGITIANHGLRDALDPKQKN